jgi:4-hydroxyphenylpyruvate dioxygenase
MSLPITGYHSYEKYVEDLDRAVKFYTKALGFKVIGRSTAAANARDGMERIVLAGGKTIHLILSKPTQDHSVAAQYLKLHPEGIGFLNFQVSDLDKACQFLKKRNATFLYEPSFHEDKYGKIAQVAIATALDDVNFRMIDDTNYDHFGPSFEMSEKAGNYSSPYGFECIDHFTCNVRTLQPLISFYKEVLGFEPFWNIEFHTNDVNPNLPAGSGLKSTVMWHPDSGIKFANNEPATPFFRNSQIDIYCRDNGGSGIQHAAFRVPVITDVVHKLRSNGVKFLDATPSYYEKLPARLKKSNFTGKIRESMALLEKDSILVDASDKGYLLQIFSLEVNRILSHPRAGVLFYEIIQREGDDGFGGGNFRALFETIEVDQIAMEKTAKQLPLELI